MILTRHSPRTAPPAIALALCLLAAPAAAQGHHDACRAPSGAWSSAAAPDLPPPPLLDGIGTSSMKVTTRSELAQKYFDQGLNLVHAFWDFEALRAFREAARQDPDCAMAYWGIHRALQYNRREADAERKAALARAVELAPRASDREQRYIQAASLLAAAADPMAGRQSFVREMEALIDRYPDDLDAKLLLADYLRQGYEPDGRPREGQLYSQAILRNVLASHPRSAAAHHYWIHAVENSSRPEDGLASAEVLPALAPRSGHIAHMPGHVYFRLGEYEKARASFLAARTVDLAYMDGQGIGPVNHWSYVHNLDYLVGNCAEDGRYQEGLTWAAELEAVPPAPGRPGALGTGFVLYGGLTARARLQMRYGHWAEAARSMEAALAREVPEGSAARDYYTGMLDYAAGMAAAEAGDLPAARARVERLTELLARLPKAPALGSDWYFGTAARILAVNLKELTGAIRSREGKHDEAMAALREAAEQERALGYWEPPHYTRPVAETLAEAYLRAGRWTEARQAYEESLELRPGNGHALLGIARAEAGAGRAAEAEQTFRKFLAAWSHADRDLAQVREAESWLATRTAGHAVGMLRSCYGKPSGQEFSRRPAPPTAALCAEASPHDQRHRPRSHRTRDGSPRMARKALSTACD